MQPSAKWRSLIVALRHAEAALTDDRRSKVAPILDASRVLDITKSKLGADAYAQLRQALVDEMMGR